MSTNRKMKIEIPTPEEDAAIHAAALSDPDNPPLSDHELTLFKRRGGRPRGYASKISTTVRFDQEVIAAFRATGRGWQTRMNDVLRDWLKTHPSGVSG
ncbi:MAG: BrnA antitoxin family protein [Magnetococcales bacterium]|nr:BrnA antitoxin family protein [Magnetococcales bacterium]